MTVDRASLCRRGSRSRPQPDRVDHDLPGETVDQQTPVEDAIQQMAKAGTRRLVVVGETGAPVGVVSLDDVLNLLADEAGAIGRLLAKQQSHLPEVLVAP